MTSKSFEEYTHPVSIRNYDDTVLRNIPPVEAIFYIITNILTGEMYIGSHKLKIFGIWLDGYYQSSSDDDFQLLFWGLQENIFDYKIIAGGTLQDMKNMENEYGVEHQVHTNPMYYNKGIPNRGFHEPARLKIVELVVQKIKDGFFDVKDNDGEWILRPTSEVPKKKYQARKSVDPNNTIPYIRQCIIENNGISKTEPLTIFGEKDEELIDGNRTFLAGKGLKQVRGYKTRVIPDSFIEQLQLNQNEKELIAELLNPRDEIKKEETDDETIYDRIQKHYDENDIEFDSKYNKEYLKLHKFNNNQIGQIIAHVKKLHEIREEKKEAKADNNSTFIEWNVENSPHRVKHLEECEKLEKGGTIVTVFGSAANGKNLIVETIDKLESNPDFEKLIVYPYFTDKFAKDSWIGKKQTRKLKNGKNKVTHTKGNKIKYVRRLDFIIDQMNEGLEEKDFKSYEIIDLPHIRSKTTEGSEDV